MIGWCFVEAFQPSTLRMVICPEAIKAQNNIAAVSAEGSTVWVLIRRLNSSCNRSIAFDVRIDFHWLFGKRVKVKSLSPAPPGSLQPRGISLPFANERLALDLDLRLRGGIDHIIVIGGDFLVQPVGRMSKKVASLCTVHRWTNMSLQSTARALSRPGAPSTMTSSGVFGRG